MKFSEIKYKPLDKDTVKIYEESYGKPIKELQEDVFNVLNSYNVSEECINHIMGYIHTWDSILNRDKYVMNILAKNKPEKQQKKVAGWEIGLDSLLDQD